MTDPKIFLAVDNCFASKRWTRPSEWLTIARDLGIRYVEASADNECDPLYTVPEYMRDWMDEVREGEVKTGTKVVNIYSGHGTYATLGLSHTDRRVRDHIQQDWIKPSLQTAAEIDAGLGFFCHAFPEHAIQEAESYGQLKDDLLKRLADIASYAAQIGVRSVSVEQMYSPHQYPWTIGGAKELIEAVYAISSCPFYVTLDTGHASGQRKYLKPGADRLKTALGECRESQKGEWPWLGTSAAESDFERALREDGIDQGPVLDRIREEMGRHPHLFASDVDGDPYMWLEEIACYAPIIHLQQTTGLSSQHLPFTERCNRDGIVEGEKVLQSIAKSYGSPVRPDMPPRCAEIYLTLELFSGTSDHRRAIINRLRESVEYWRRLIPVDGMSLDELLSRQS